MFIGNQLSAGILKRAIRNRRGQVFLITGPAHIGKRTLAVLAVQEALDISLDRVQADYYHLQCDEERKAISIEQAKTAIKFLQKKSLYGQGMILLIERADLLTREAANALLLTLENPPQDAVIILTAGHESSLLATIRSRCLIVRLNIVSEKIIEQALRKHYRNISSAKLAEVIKLACGLPGRALTLARLQGQLTKTRKVRADIEQWSRGGLSDRLALATKYSRDKENIKLFLYEMSLAAPLSWRRGLIACQRRLDNNVQGRALLEAFAMLEQ